VLGVRTSSFPERGGNIPTGSVKRQATLFDQHHRPPPTVNGFVIE